MSDPVPTIDLQLEPRETASADSVNVAIRQPTAIGRYRIERLLGKGGFGLVFLAHDEQLARPVAIKVPHAQLVARADDAAAYLTEARIVANLDHPNIVPVHDVGSTEKFPCYIVSKFIEGSDLATRLTTSRPTLAEAANLSAIVAEALHYAHGQGLVHRDIKPGNILLDTAGKPYVVDFGLALKEEDVGKADGYAGTPAYMSPEQARGEGHRVDRRSDIFSLGVVFYELLTGRRPFGGKTVYEILEQVTALEARPPRQFNDAIPKELERICLKALSKRATERYTTARDLADDLRHFLAQASDTEKAGAAVTFTGDRSVAAMLPLTTAFNPSFESQPLKIVPKGLRSFDEHDDDFFLELLPGPRDREGLPDSIRFWKTRIEESDADNTFSVGLIYGPSGCGKSSLVKAGLLPRLSDDVIAVYVEATPGETETRLLNGLRKRFDDLPIDLGLKETLAALRRGQSVQTGKKVLIVLDQFEQWLHAKKDEQNAELVQALRQCDGGHVQCIVMVRDDFWLVVSRFMTDVEVELVQGRNMALVDLFDARHARKVLKAFGRAFGEWSELDKGPTKEQEAFLDQAIAGLAQDGKVISVRLALFAEMVKGKPWTPATLKEVGGMEGVGVTFLEESFAASTAPPQHRLHQKSAQAVLKTLLPDIGTDIRGNMRSQHDLLESSGYAAQPKNFDALLRILDGELRLITPTDLEGKEEGSATSLKAAKYYQLTHDYLVPSLRDWLTRKQKETRRGRAELRLAERSALWNAKPENRHLPVSWEWANIRLRVPSKSWNEAQRKMMRMATRYHAVRGTVLAVVLVALSATGLLVRSQIIEQNKTTHAAGLVQRLLDAETAQVPGVVAELSEYRQWADPLLREENVQAVTNSRQKLHVSLALLPVDATPVDYLFGRLLDAKPHEVSVIRDALAPHKDALLDKLWAVVEAPEKGLESQRLRAAAALAKYDAENQRWANSSKSVVNRLVAENPVFLGVWIEGFRPIKDKLLASLANIYRNTDGRESERTLATNILADYAADQPQVLADLVMDADDKQFSVIYPKFNEQSEQGLSELIREINRKPQPDAKDEAKEKLAKRQANAGMALLRMKHPEKVWPLLKHSPDPRVRSYLIHRLSPLGADAKAIINRLDEEPDLTIRRALILSLGEFSEKEFSPNDRKSVLPKLQEMYRTATDPGLHAASEWLLRTWKEEAWLKQMNEEWAKDQEQRGKRLEGIKQLLTKDNVKSPPQWYVNGQGQTMVVVPGPVEFVMGSPTTEEGRIAHEILHQKRINRTFAIAAQAVTVREYRRFDPTFTYVKQYAPSLDCPVIDTSWHQAAAYCNWLSKEEGLDEDQRCYEIQNGQVTQIKANFLSLTGYRLPTEAEMEYATRAGAVTSRFYGETDELLNEYGWFSQNALGHSWPVGSKKPNDLGLFDMYGNVWCWCQEQFQPYPQDQGDGPEENDDTLVINENVRVMRGGSFHSNAGVVRSAYRFWDMPTLRLENVGFRVARTFTVK